MASSREKPGNSPVKTKERPERQSIEAGVGGVLMSVGVGVELGNRISPRTRRVVGVVVNDGVPITCTATIMLFVHQDSIQIAWLKSVRDRKSVV